MQDELSPRRTFCCCCPALSFPPKQAAQEVLFNEDEAKNEA
jgi:hypothetical protein